MVWDWKKGTPLSQAVGHQDHVYDVKFSPYETNVIVTVGAKHIKFWALSGNTLKSKRGIFGKAGDPQDQLCIAFGPTQVTYSGTADGSIYMWQGNTLKSQISRAHKGGLFTIHMSKDGYVTGGRDGSFRLWDDQFKALATVSLADTGAITRGLSIRSVCWSGEKVLCGTANGEVIEIDVRESNPKFITQGHAGELWGLACHPTKGVFVTAGDDKLVQLWDFKARKVVAQTNVAHHARSATFSKNGHLAVGQKEARVTILDSETLNEIYSFHPKDRREVIHEMKYSPDGRILAVRPSLCM